jgi:hypothetical protein
MENVKNCAISLEIPKFCFNVNSFLKFTWIIRNNGNYIPKVKYFFKSTNQIYSSITLKFSKANSFLLKVEFNYFTNILKSIKICLRINRILKSSGFFDFIYFPGSKLRINENLCQNFSSKSFENKFLLFHKKSIDLSVDLIPISFTRFKHFKNGFNFKKKNFNSKKNEKFYSNYFSFKNAEFNPLGLDKRSFFFDKSKIGSIIDFKRELAPKLPFCTLRGNLKLIPSFAVGFLLRLYKHRPIWTKRSLDMYLPISLKKHIKKIFPIISYRFNGINPFKDTWIRLNYEPRKNSRTYIYQTIGFQEKIKPSSTTKISNRKKNYNIYQKNCNSKYQFCDLNLVKIRKIPLLQPTTRLTFESGWIK